MNSYEITFLVADAKDADAVKKTITSLDGKVKTEKHWGTQTLAYQIIKKDSLDFFTWSIEMEPKNLFELKKKLNFDDLVVRYLILKEDEKKAKKKSN